MSHQENKKINKYIYIYMYIVYMYLHVCIDLYIHVRCCIYSKCLHVFPIIYSATKKYSHYCTLSLHIMVSSLLVFLLLVSGIIHFSCEML